MRPPARPRKGASASGVEGGARFSASACDTKQCSAPHRSPANHGAVGLRCAEEHKTGETRVTHPTPSSAHAAPVGDLDLRSSKGFFPGTALWYPSPGL